MKKVFTAALLALSLASPALAGQGLTPQQQKMKACNEEATNKGMSGTLRRQFMGECLKGQPAGGTEKALTPQQQKMKACNEEATAKSLTGPERKKFMSTCLKGS